MTVVSVTTYFKPIVHGWPFGNNWTYEVKYTGITKSMGFCGGMCWRALHYFYNGIPIPWETGTLPTQGDPVYNEIWNAQKDSLTLSKIAKIISWQARSDVDHTGTPDSLGHLTQDEWVKVMNKLDSSKPVTLTVIRSSNDANPAHLSDNHRVVAYGYVMRELSPSEEGIPKGATHVVELQIYDPNESGKDNVWLRFYLGAEGNNIRITHSSGIDVHGFFLDDKDRSYAHQNPYKVKIDSCVPTGTYSIDKADYDLTFSWSCQFVPYFYTQINDNPKVLRKDKNLVASKKVTIQLPRDQCKVTLRFLDSDNYAPFVNIDAKPRFTCYPYVRKRANSDALCVYDTGIDIANDLYINVRSPSQTEIKSLDTEFRWIITTDPNYGPHSTGGSTNPTMKYVSGFVDSYWLGNIIVPIYGNFEEKNLGQARKRRLTVTLVKNNNQRILIETLNSLNNLGQRIYAGFTKDGITINPKDYDDDSRIEAYYEFEESTGLKVHGTTIFYAKSIIFKRTFTGFSVLDPSSFARFEAAAHKLIEMGLVETAIQLPHPQPVDPFDISQKIVNNPRIQLIINRTLASVVADPRVMSRVNQKEILGEDTTHKIKITKVELDKSKQGLLNAIEGTFVGNVVEDALDKIRGDRNALNELGKI